MRAIWGVAILATACASAKDGSQTSGSGAASAATSAAPPSAIAPASAGPEQAASAKASATESDAATLKRLGGTYLCDQRIYPRGEGAHITAWEWAFTIEPAELANKLARELPGSEREDMMFRFMNAAGTPDVVVSVEPPDKSRLDCKEIPSGTKSLVVASRR